MRLALCLAAFGLGFSALAAPGDPVSTAPYLEEAQKQFAEGDYNASRDLCEAILGTKPNDAGAKTLLARNKEQLERLAHESYGYGALLESFNRVEEAKQYWQRAAHYTRPGDRYHDWIHERLDHYK